MTSFKLALGFLLLSGAVACASSTEDPATADSDVTIGGLPQPTLSCGGFAGLLCGANQFCDYEPSSMCGAADHLGTCKERPEACAQIVDPVCGCDGKTYSNGCVANAAGTAVARKGTCQPPPPPPARRCRGVGGCGADEFCDFELSAMCGAADHLGTCKERPQACAQVIDPVCGCDGRTYSNTCAANAAGTAVVREGACP